MTIIPHTDDRPTAAPVAQRPTMSPGILLLRALLACAAAVLAALSITLVIRAVLNVDAFQDAGAISEGFPNSGALSVGVITATLLAVLVLQLLLRFSPKPFAAFLGVMTLGYLAFLGVSVTSNLTRSQITGQLIVCLGLAAVITVLASWVTGVGPDTP